MEGGRPSPEREKEGRKVDIEKLVLFIKGDSETSSELNNSISVLGRSVARSVKA